MGIKPKKYNSTFRSLKLVMKLKVQAPKKRAQNRKCN
jgi:hypothetical protein